jgi:HK97 family phage major capsid protein
VNIDQLDKRRQEILAQLEDPGFSGDVEELFRESTDIRKQIDEFNGKVAKADEVRAMLAGGPAGRTIRPAGSPTTEPLGGQQGHSQAPDMRSWGRRFVDEGIAKRYAAHGARGPSEALEFAGADFDSGGYSTRALLTGGDAVYTGTNAGAFQRPPLQPWVAILNPDRILRIIDVIDRGTTDNSSVDFVQDTTAAGGLGGVAAETFEGAIKPEAAATFTQKTAPVRTVAHYIPITRQALTDNPMLQSFIDGRLRYGLLRRLDSQIINGTGVAPNLTGILNTSGIGTYAPGAAEARLISLRRGRTIAELSELVPDVVIINPADWEKVDLLTAAASGEFMAGPGGQLVERGVAGVTDGNAVLANQGIRQGGQLARTLWGMIVIPTTAVASGVALLGNFAEAATLWDRQQTQVLISDSHADFFIRNQLALLAEARVALTVQQPLAFVKITFNGTT